MSSTTCSFPTGAVWSARSRPAPIACTWWCLRARPHNRKNLNREPEETLAGYAEVVAEARAAGVAVYGAIATAFGCPYEGRTPNARVCELADRFFELGVDEVGLGDTTGMANPAHSEALCTELRRTGR